MAIIIREAGRDTTTNMEVIARRRRCMVLVLEIIGMATSLQVKNQIV
ncbi:hypothetical protein [Acidithiobacillus concretivorus]|uniref:Uncharacterized protein n=1 Tax=Acidithiobacillus concretivorus TaxID=3063952 RepID=A0ABS5ZSQ5_9PROT|nr:hypothetical protein [Acidithiobacillus concretivorus]MBU2739681.1 hypothetical protein [Acidithiobacillus concretivorus]